MLAFISFILVCIGCINWFCIGILQYDFVAGIFGSQSNIFSRLVYTLVGVASIVVIANFITNKGKFVVSFKKANKEYHNYMEEKKEDKKSKLIKAHESGEDHASQQHLDTRHTKEYYGLESSEDNALDNNLNSSQSKNNDAVESAEDYALDNDMRAKQSKAKEHYGLESAEDFGLNEQKIDKTSSDDKYIRSKHKD